MNKNEIEIIKPDDFHLHIRNFPLAENYVKRSAVAFKRAIIMPNTIPPIATVTEMNQYKASILSVVPNFIPLMSFKLSSVMKPEDIFAFKKAGAMQGKLYPKGATTNSEDGVDSIQEMFPLFKAMEEANMILSIHGEDPKCPVFERERGFLPTLRLLNKKFPKLKIILEHISTKEGIKTVLELPKEIAGTITLHHLLYSREEMLGGAMNPNLFCKPILQSPEDREAIQAAAFSGNSKFFFGSDSAPHPKEKKLNSKVAAGIYSAPVLLPALVQFFEEKGHLENQADLEKFQDFTARYGAEFYGLPINTERIVLERKTWTVPAECDGVIPLEANKELKWALKNVKVD